jgi:hypothetical protein
VTIVTGRFASSLAPPAASRKRQNQQDSGTRNKNRSTSFSFLIQHTPLYITVKGMGQAVELLLHIC